MNRSSVAVYIHWPFCKSKCPYCDFNSHVRDEINEKDWYDAYLIELKYFCRYLEGKTVSSIFFGGGTPSLMPPELVASVIEALTPYINDINAIEITLEANPTSVEASRFHAFKQAGVNRVSLGVQSFNNKDLAFLGREHSANEALNAIDLARSLFERYSFDLIYARPNQTKESWKNELIQSLNHAKGHLSLYQLTMEKGTPFYSAYAKGKFPLPNEEQSEVLYWATEEIMIQHGYDSYEVSNYAQKGHECQHNLHYWHYGDYIGIGAGAHSRVTVNDAKLALMTIHHPENWLKSVNDKGHGLQSQQKLSAQEMLEEMLLMGLRLTEGVGFKNIEASINKEKIAFCIKQSLLKETADKLQATDQGRMVLNSLVAHLCES